MATKIITGEQPFQIPAHSFSVSPSSGSYTLAYSANGEDYTNYEEATPASENLIVNGVGKFMYFKLVGNSDEVTITY